MAELMMMRHSATFIAKNTGFFFILYPGKQVGDAGMDLPAQFKRLGSNVS